MRSKNEFKLMFLQNTKMNSDPTPDQTSENRTQNALLNLIDTIQNNCITSNTDSECTLPQINVDIKATSTEDPSLSVTKTVNLVSVDKSMDERKSVTVDLLNKISESYVDAPEANLRLGPLGVAGGSDGRELENKFYRNLTSGLAESIKENQNPVNAVVTSMCDMMRECVGNIDWPKDVPSRTADPVTNVFSSLIRGLSDLTQPTEKNNSTPNNQTSAPPTDKPDNQTPQTETSSNNTNQFMELLSNLFGGLLNVGQTNNSDGDSTETLNNNPTPDKSAPTD